MDEFVVKTLAVSEVVCEVETSGPVTEAVEVAETAELLEVTGVVDPPALLVMIVLSLDLDSVGDSVIEVEDDVLVLEDKTRVVLRVENEYSVLP